ncbi:MAG: FadR family transcriptional regulator [Bryobacter sp.]|jgi:DNA-binding FadR family transcriptional regulator|nr:FadR family transcriptional regulator [Bryobacter sp.]
MATTTPGPRFRSLQSKNGLVDRVVSALEGKIIQGKLAVGTRLPPERQLAEQLGVSRTALREAVRILVSRGLLETRHGIGTTVRMPTRDQVVGPLSLLLRTGVQPVSVEHLHQVRSILEVENAGNAASAATIEDVARLRALCAEMLESFADADVFAEKDAEFHRAIAAATHNPLLSVLLDSLQDLMAEVRHLVAARPHLPERVMPTHVEVVDAIAARDAAAARDAMRRHLEIAIGLQQEALAG